MLVKYGAYLLRCWGEEAQVRRVEIVHIQTGERVLLGSTDEALGWIDERARQAERGGVDTAFP